MKSILLTGLLTITVSCAMAQVSFGPAFGLLSSNYTGNSEGSAIDAKAKVGINAGGEVNIGLNKKFYLQTGLQYVMNGFQITDPLATEKVTIRTLEVPVMAAYKFGKPGKDGFFVAAGPYFGFNMSGKAVENSSYYGNQSESLSTGNDSSDVARKLDLGLRVCIGYGIEHGFFVFAHYQNSIINIMPDANVNGSLYNRNFGITVGYLFSSKGKKKDPVKNKE